MFLPLLSDDRGGLKECFNGHLMLEFGFASVVGVGIVAGPFYFGLCLFTKRASRRFGFS